VQATIKNLQKMKLPDVDPKTYSKVMSDEKECRGGNSNACERLFGGYSKLCRGGVAASCYHLAEMLRTGRGLPEASVTSKVSESDGNIDASGVVPPEKERAARACELYGQACAKQHLRACFERGLMLAHGAPGVPEDRKAGVELLESACDRGHTNSCLTIANAAMSKRRRTKADATRAAEYFGKACALGNPVACYNLGLMHHHGAGVEKDLHFAFHCLSRACGRGVDVACAAARNARRDMTGEERRSLDKELRGEVGKDTSSSTESP
jgi:TPR repeat protein